LSFSLFYTIWQFRFSPFQRRERWRRLKKPGVHRKGAGLFFGRGVKGSYNHFGVEKKKD
jgi:hypothetical protein